jgi:hypothetical protein
MFIELWSPLQVKLHENNSEDSIVLCKRLINDTLQDLSNMFTWEFLTDMKSYTTTADDQMVILDGNTPYNLDASAIMYAYCTATGDSGTLLTINGKRINADNTFDITSESLTLCTTATATGAIGWSHIDSFIRTGTTGDVVVIGSDGTELLRIENDVKVSKEDIGKITCVNNLNSGKEIVEVDPATILKGGLSVSSGTLLFSPYTPCYALLENGIGLANVGSGSVLLITYQKTPRVLNQNIDRTEFPRQLWPKIIEAAFLNGLRHEDESDGDAGLQAYIPKLQEIVSDWVMGRGQSTIGRPRVMPVGVKRRI